MRKLMWFTIGFGAACAVGSYFYQDWLIFASIAALLAFGAMLFFYKRWRFLCRCMAVVLGLGIGLGWFCGYHALYLGTAAKYDGQECAINAVAVDYSYASGFGTAVEADILLEGKSYRAILYLNETALLDPETQVSGNFRLRLTHEGQEADTYHRGNGVFLLGYAQDSCQIVQAQKISAKHYPAVMRREILLRLEQTFPEDTAGFAKALLLGDRSDVDYETNTAFKVSGISHIIAVSGLHISILFTVVARIIGRKRFLEALIGIPVLILFAAMVGFTPSITRACIMQILMIVATLIDRDYDPPIALSFACMVMLLINPVVITSVSFQLSVGCMAGMFLCYEPISNWILNLPFWEDWEGRSRKNHSRHLLASGIGVTLSSMFFTTPLVAYYFGTVSLISVVSNLLILWVVTWIFYGILLVCLLSFIWTPLATVVAWLLSWLIRYVLTMAKWLSSIPMAAVYTKSEYIILWLVLCYVLVFVLVIQRRNRPELGICCSIIGLCVALCLSWATPLVDECRMTVLDVGQGQSILLQAQGRTFLVDCGGDREEEAADIASETLLSMGIHKLDGIILTHYDSDHAAGLSLLLTRVHADAVYLPKESDDPDIQGELLEKCNFPVFVEEDTLLSWETGSLTIFAPLFQSSDNERGLCVLFREGNCDILITGDMSIPGENRLLMEKNIPELTVLVAGHHGSKYSTGDSLLSVTTPEYVIISAGRDNPYGHPSQEVLERLENWECEVLRTDLEGTIVFRR